MCVIIDVLVFVLLVMGGVSFCCIRMFRREKAYVGRWRELYEGECRRFAELQQKFDKQVSELAAMQNTVAASNTDRNHALDMAAAISTWRNAHWKDTTCQLVHALSPGKEHEDAMLAAARAVFDDETEKLDQIIKLITDRGSFPITPASISAAIIKNGSLPSCKQSSSPADLDSSEAR